MKVRTDHIRITAPHLSWSVSIRAVRIDIGCLDVLKY